MSIEHTCPSCQMRLRGADESAGKKVRCKCGAVSVVPAASPRPAAAAPPAAAAAAGSSSVVTCSHCQQTLRVPASAAGKAVRCKCGQVVPVPAAAKPATASTPKPGPAAVAATKTAAVAKPAAAAKPVTTAKPAAPAKPVTATVAGRPAAPTATSVVATAPARAAVPAASIFDELTDADWNRESPIKRAFAAPAASKDGAVLKQWVGNELPKSAVRSGGPTPVGLILLSIVNFLFGAFYIFGGIAIVALVQFASMVEKLQAAMPALQMNALLLCGFLVFWGIFDLAIGVGLLQRSAWGWYVAAVGYASWPVTIMGNIVQAVMKMEAGLPAARIAGMFVGFAMVFSLGVALTTYLFLNGPRRHFGIKGSTPVIGCAIAGVLVGIASITYLLVLNQATQSVIPAGANAG